MRTFFVRNAANEVKGPYTSEQLREFGRLGQILPSDCVSEDGQNWVLATNVRGLFSVDGEIAKHLRTELEVRQLSRDEMVQDFLQTFVFENPTFQNSLFVFKMFKQMVAELTLPKKYVVAQVQHGRATYVEHNLKNGSTKQLTHEEFNQVVDSGITQADWFRVFGIVVAVLWFFLTFATWDFLLSVLYSAFALTIAAAGWIVKTKQTQKFVGYKLDVLQEDRLREIRAMVERVTERPLWSITGTSDADRKYHAGFDRKIHVVPVKRFRQRIPNITTNVRIVGITFGRVAMYFLPDSLCLFDGRNVLHFEYSSLGTSPTTMEYLPLGGTVPNGAKILSKKWKYVNNDGTPDKRFKDNPEILILQYFVLDLDLSGIANFQFATTDHLAPQAFASALSNMTN